MTVERTANKIRLLLMHIYQSALAITIRTTTQVRQHLDMPQPINHQLKHEPVNVNNYISSIRDLHNNSITLGRMNAASSYEANLFSYEITNEANNFFVDQSELSMSSLFDGLNPSQKMETSRDLSLTKRLVKKLLSFKLSLDLRKRQKREFDIITPQTELYL